MGENGAGKSTLIKAITGALAPRRRASSGSTARRCTSASPHDAQQLRDPRRLPGDRPAPEHLGRREHRARLRAAPVRDDRLGADARATRTPSSPTSGSTSTPPRPSAGTRWPCSSSWRSRGRSSPTSGCWCSTSRRRASTSTSAPSCSASSATSRSAASRSCSSPTSSTRSTRSATASPCCATASSSASTSPGELLRIDLVHAMLGRSADVAADALAAARRRRVARSPTSAPAR